MLAELVPSAPAQRQFDELRKRGLPGDSDDTFAVHSAMSIATATSTWSAGTGGRTGSI